MIRRRFLAVFLGIAHLAAGLFLSSARGEEFLTGIEWQQPPIVTPADQGGPPSDAVVLFDGTDLSAWENGDRWTVEDGVAIIGKGDIRTKQSFGDCQLHVEWSAPLPVTGEGQGRGNSGVYLMNTYEMQVLDSYDNRTYFDGQAAGIYKQTPPLVNAMRPPGQWNAYDIVWTGPRFNEDGSLASPAYITALHNGVVVLNHFELHGDTPFHRPPTYKKHPDKLPIRLQDHGNPVRFRNIWVREIKPLESTRKREPYLREGDREWPVKQSTSRAAISGVVTLAGEPLPAGTIRIQQVDGAKARLETKVVDGQYSFGDAAVPAGKYRVGIEGDKE